MGMLTVVYDGVKSFVVPDCAECILAEKHPNDMDECPLWKCEAKDECDPDCEFYTEAVRKFRTTNEINKERK